MRESRDSGSEKDILTGKTYTLTLINNDSQEYFKRVRFITDRLLEVYNNNSDTLLSHLRDASGSQRKYKAFKEVVNNTVDFSNMENDLSEYMSGLDEHLAELKIRKRFDKTIGLKQYQYILFMLEIEITNRINISAFRDSEYKLALLPHCLHDMEKDCLAESDGLEYVCKRCSKKCYNRQMTDLLRAFNAHPYIWMNLSLKSILKRIYKDYRSIGILGIACIPELVHGMRRCYNAGIPAVGIPLNANRCVRWFGEFYPNSVDLDEIEKLFVQ